MPRRLSIACLLVAGLGACRDRSEIDASAPFALLGLERQADGSPRLDPCALRWGRGGLGLELVTAPGELAIVRALLDREASGSLRFQLPPFDGARIASAELLEDEAWVPLAGLEGAMLIRGEPQADGCHPCPCATEACDPFCRTLPGTARDAGPPDSG